MHALPLLLAQTHQHRQRHHMPLADYTSLLKPTQRNSCSAQTNSLACCLPLKDYSGHIHAPTVQCNERLVMRAVLKLPPIRLQPPIPTAVCSAPRTTLQVVPCPRSQQSASSRSPFTRPRWRLRLSSATPCVRCSALHPHMPPHMHATAQSAAPSRTRQALVLAGKHGVVGDGARGE